MIGIAFQEVADATEEAILNSLFQAETLEGIDGDTWETVPIEEGVRLLQACGAIG